MKITRKFIGFAVALTLFATQFTPVLAEESGSGNGDANGTSATANILANTVDSVIVPTTLKVALNPNKYGVIIRYHEVALDAGGNNPATSGTDYFYNDSGVMKKYSFATGEDLDDAAAAGDGKVYTADKIARDTKQIISLNYGISNKSTKAKIIKTDFKISYTPKTGSAADGTSPIIFVDEADKANPKSGTNTGGADTNELKMFLQVETAKEDIKARETYEVAASYTDANTVYYKWDSSTSKFVLEGTDGKLAQQSDFDAIAYKLYTLKPDSSSGYTVNPATTAAQLSDVVLTASTDTTSPRVFKLVDGGTATNYANTGAVYKLPQASYSEKAESTIDFSTTQTQLQTGVVECTAVNGVTGFTFSGTMNTDCDWTKADTVAINITPKYTIRDLRKGETTNAIDNTANQVTLNPYLTFTDAGVITLLDLPEGKTVKAVTVSYTKGGTAKTNDLKDSSDMTWNTDFTSGTMTAGWTDYLVGCGEVTVTYTITDGTTDSTLTASATF